MCLLQKKNTKREEDHMLPCGGGSIARRLYKNKEFISHARLAASPQ